LQLIYLRLLIRIPEIIYCTTWEYAAELALPLRDVLLDAQLFILVKLILFYYVALLQYFEVSVDLICLQI